MEKSPSLLGTMKSKAIRWLEDNRGLVIVLFCLPASFVSFVEIPFTRRLAVRSGHADAKLVQENLLVGPFQARGTGPENPREGPRVERHTSGQAEAHVHGEAELAESLDHVLPQRKTLPGPHRFVRYSVIGRRESGGQSRAERQCE